MLSLLSCSAPRIDEYDPYAAPPSPSLRPFRRASRSLSFIRSPSRRKVSKMSIGSPVNFRHEFHIGMDIIASDSVSVWDATRFLDELRAQQNAATSPVTAASPQITSPSTPPPTPSPALAQKRNSITPQKRKPVPPLDPDVPPISPVAQVSPSLADIPRPLSPAVFPLPLSPIEVALPPSPIDSSPLSSPVATDSAPLDSLPELGGS